jgi:hypothetical protein
LESPPRPYAVVYMPPVESSTCPRVSGFELILQ